MATPVRAALYRGDGAAVVALFPLGVPANALQRVGDGLLSALAQDVAGARELAVACGADLRERAWEGDDELADQLDPALRTGSTPMLRRLGVDLDELSEILNESEDRRLGGAVVAFDTAGVDLLGGRSELAVLWDIRVQPEPAPREPVRRCSAWPVRGRRPAAAWH